MTPNRTYAVTEFLVDQHGAADALHLVLHELGNAQRAGDEDANRAWSAVLRALVMIRIERRVLAETMH
jgi:hypothetical protein